jgi:cell division protein FtsL
VSRYRFFITKRVANDHLVREVDRRRHRALWLQAMTGLVLAAALLGYGWQHFEMIRMGYRLEELRLEKESLMKLNRLLALEREHLVSPDRVEAIARTRLGMVTPTSEQLVFVEETSDGVAELEAPDQRAGQK